MTDQSVYGGLFKDPTYLSSDIDPKKTDPYDKQDTIPSRYLGKNMVVGHSAPGQHPDAYFEKKYLTLASSEQNGGKPVGYADATAAKGGAADGKKNAIADHQFKYPSFPHKSTGPGSYYGCFQEKPYEYMTEPWDDGKKKKKRRQAAAADEKPGKSLPNIKTNPSKKGTYGYPGLLLEKEAYNDNWRAELTAQEKEEQKRAKRQGPAPKPIGAPFKVIGVSHAYLDELPSTGAPGVYTEYVAPEDKKTKRRGGAGKAGAAAPKPLHEKPFRGSTVKSGDEGCINPFPNIWVDPSEVEAAKKGKSKRRKQADADAESHRPKGAPEWKPNSFEKTSIVSSCLRRFY